MRPCNQDQSLDAPLRSLGAVNVGAATLKQSATWIAGAMDVTSERLRPVH